MAKKIKKMPETEIQRELKTIPNWTYEDGKLHREFVFKDFMQAISFMTGVSITAQIMNHHPEWFNVYNKVKVDLCTHDVHGLTILDFTLAAHMEEFASNFRQ